MSTDYETEIRELEDELEDIRAEIAELEDTIEDLESDNEYLRDENYDLEITIEKLNEEIDDLEDSLGEYVRTNHFDGCHIRWDAPTGLWVINGQTVEHL